MRVLKNIVFLFFVFSLIIFSMAGNKEEKKPKSLVITGARLIDGTGAPPFRMGLLRPQGPAMTNERIFFAPRDNTGIIAFVVVK